MEKVELRRETTQAKIIGTITSISGALVITFYRVPKVFSSSPWTSSSFVQLQSLFQSSRSNWIFCGILEAIAYLLYSFWYVIQARTIHASKLNHEFFNILHKVMVCSELEFCTTLQVIYPEEIVVNLFYNLSVELLAVPVCLIAYHSKSSMIGAVIITCGLYAVLWGKAKEAEEIRDEEPSSSGRVPLLQSYKC
ncbi:WAT1-related protein At5g40240-like [Hibiscus syriacus]|uniref:WAT1-related protein At5g40240-like n=1 Tax=Hibiscus syriacus TaxID=106335 RepID=UPI00192361A0|nr:WAT1-related protein At5g40240-like [Hibiscus syriacus]